MDPQYKSIRSRLRRVTRKVEEKRYPQDRPEWQGADVVITSIEPQRSHDSFYPEPRYVVTRFAKALSWLFEEMRDTFSSQLDGCNKIEFYGRLANMANRYQTRFCGGNPNEGDLLQAVIHEAYSILEEMEEDRFQCLPIAVGNTILDDLIEQAEAGGYLGEEESCRLIDEMNRRCFDAS